MRIKVVIKSAVAEGPSDALHPRYSRSAKLLGLLAGLSRLFSVNDVSEFSYVSNMLNSET